MKMYVIKVFGHERTANGSLKVIRKIGFAAKNKKEAVRRAREYIILEGLNAANCWLDKA